MNRKPHNLQPHAKMLLSSLRSMGYTDETAIADIVDNSISSGASEIQIYFDWEKRRILIADNGNGMNNDELLKAMEIGSADPALMRAADDLGRFGMGMKTASFSLGKSLYVITKQNEIISNAEWDLDYVETNDKWEVLIHPQDSIQDEIDSVAELIDYSKWNQGTLIILSKLDKLIDENNIDKSKKKFYKTIKDINSHIVENNKNAARTYINNHPGLNNYEDILTADFQQIKRDCGKIDVVIGGPPCQGFSNANRTRRQLINGSNELVKRYVKAIEEIKPRVFVMENVKTIASDKHSFCLTHSDENYILNELGISVHDKEIILYEGKNVEEVYSLSDDFLGKLDQLVFLTEEELYFVYNIYKKRKQLDNARNDHPTPENILIFDEAQRVWNEEKMTRKHEKDPDMSVSEPHLLFRIMNRHQQWAVMICLVGLGQDIYDGEVGINEWFRCGIEEFTDWELYYSPSIFTQIEDKAIDRDLIQGCSRCHQVEALHLKTSIRSFRADKQCQFVDNLLDNKPNAAKT